MIIKENLMIDQNKSSSQPDAPSPLPRRRGGVRIALLVVAVALSAGLVGSVGTAAFSYGSRPWHAGGFMGGSIDPAEIEHRVERMIKHLAIEVDATPDQQAKLITIAKAATGDLLPLRDKAYANRRQGLALLAAANVDRAAIERLRTEQMGLAETASKRVAQALADAADVLTPEQRKDIAERVTSGRWGWWHGR
jgi:periplasmic protein CpxP/Spy